MTPIQSCILNKNTRIKPVWIMRQAGRYLPEFRRIRKDNKDFIKLCLNKKIIPKITLQPLNRFDLDAAIIFSDILMIPYGLGQNVQFSKELGPQLGDLKIDKISSKSKVNFTNILKPIYSSLQNVSKNKLLKNKDLIGFVGSPWTLLVYMLNKSSPKKNLKKKVFKDKILIKELFKIIVDFTNLHILQQVKSGATLIQLFDSWAGLVSDSNLEDYIYIQNKKIVDFTKKLNVPVICFPRGIKNYSKFVNNVKPDVISIDYDTDPKIIKKNIDIPVQGGMNPKILLGDKNQIKKGANKYIEIFRDHPYIFNLGHGILPETKPEMLEYLIKVVKNG